MRTLILRKENPVGAWLKSHAPTFNSAIYVLGQCLNGVLLQYGISHGIGWDVSFPSVPIINSTMPLVRGLLALISAQLLRTQPSMLRVFMVITVLETIAITTSIGMVVAYNVENPKVEIPGGVQPLPDNIFGGK